MGETPIDAKGKEKIYRILIKQDGDSKEKILAEVKGRGEEYERMAWKFAKLALSINQHKGLHARCIIVRPVPSK
jgi:hypothetical protein